MQGSGQGEVGSLARQGSAGAGVGSGGKCVTVILCSITGIEREMAVTVVCNTLE